MFVRLQHLPFCSWLISLNIKPSRFFCFVANGRFPLFFGCSFKTECDCSIPCFLFMDGYLVSFRGYCWLYCSEHKHAGSSLMYWRGPELLRPSCIFFLLITVHTISNNSHDLRSPWGQCGQEGFTEGTTLAHENVWEALGLKGRGIADDTRRYRGQATQCPKISSALLIYLFYLFCGITKSQWRYQKLLFQGNC